MLDSRAIRETRCVGQGLSQEQRLKGASSRSCPSLSTLTRSKRAEERSEGYPSASGAPPLDGVIKPMVAPGKECDHFCDQTRWEWKGKNGYVRTEWNATGSGYC